MVKLKNILKVLVLISLPLFLSACSNSSGIWSNDVAGNAAQNNSDISIGFLGQLFGTVGDAVQGTNNQLLGQLFYQFNLGVLTVIGVFLIYTVLVSALRGANEGSFQGQGKNVAYYFLKIALGVGMVIPSSTTGYCMAQRLMMDVTVAGVHLADNIWNTALTYLDDGHAVWVDPTESDNQVSSMINGDTFNAFMGNPDSFDNSTDTETTYDKELGYNVLSSEICMLSKGLRPNPTIYLGQEDPNNNSPYLSQYRFSDGGGGSGSDAGCGSIDWSLVNRLKDYTNNDNSNGSLCVAENEHNDDADGYTSMYCQQAQTAISGVISDMVPAAYKIYCSSSDHAGESVCTGYTNQTDASDDIFRADVNYTNNIYAAYDHMNNTGGDFSQARTDGEQDGWMMAGRYYWDMASKDANIRSASQIGNYNATTDDAIVGPTNFSLDDSSKSLVEGYFDAAKTEAKNYANEVDGANNSAVDTSDAYDVGHANTSNAAANVVIRAITPGIVQIGTMFGDTSIYANPVEWLTLLGQSLIKFAGGLFIGLCLTFVTFSLTANVFDCMSSIGYSVTELSNWVRSIMMAVIAVLLVPGFILGYYCPLYPFMVFTFGVIAWLVFVIESMAAAPLVALGLTHPDGHDFLGKAEQAVMLALGVFLRPALMILGLISGMILSFVAFKIINYTFANFMQDLFLHNSVAEVTHNSSNINSAIGKAMGNAFCSSGDLFTLMFAFPMMLVIFATIVMEVTHQCYGLIHQLPDYIMRWIGAPNASSPLQVDKMTGSVQGAVSAGGAKAGGLGESVNSAVGSRISMGDANNRANPSSSVDNGGEGGGNGEGGGDGKEKGDTNSDTGGS